MKIKQGIPVDPVRDVERAIHAERCKVMRSDSFRLAGALEHEQLRKDSDGLEIDGEGPEDLCEGERIVEYEGEHQGRSEEVFKAEGVD